jgi:DNA-binding transcriptional LysR family regulator
MTLAAYGALPHILIAPGGELKGTVDKILNKKKQTRKIAVGTSGFLSAGWAVVESDAVLTAPSRLIAAFEKYLPIQSFDAPLDLPSITVVQVWHERFHRDPAHKWLREKLRASFSN